MIKETEKLKTVSEFPKKKKRQVKDVQLHE